MEYAPTLATETNISGIYIYKKERIKPMKKMGRRLNKKSKDKTIYELTKAQMNKETIDAVLTGGGIVYNIISDEDDSYSEPYCVATKEKEGILISFFVMPDSYSDRTIAIFFSAEIKTPELMETLFGAEAFSPFRHVCVEYAGESLDGSIVYMSPEALV